jgi:predicted dehydrogenase
LSSSELRVAFAGAGLVAELHQAALARRDDAILVGLTDSNAELAKRRSREWGVPAYDSLDALLDEARADAVFVLCSNQAHVPVAERAIAAGQHVLVEKPVADASGCERLRRQSEAAGVVCMPGHNYAYQPEFTRLLRLMRENALGTVRAAWVTYVLQHDEDVAARYAGIISELLVHHSYLTYALLGAPSRVHAGRMEPAWKHLARDDQAWMVWDYRSQATAHLFGSFALDDDTCDPWTFVVKVLGSQGGVTYSWRSARMQRAIGSHRFALPCYEESYEYELDAFLRAVRGDPSAIVSSIADAGAVARLLDRAAVVTGADRGRYLSGAFDVDAER